MAAQSAMYSYVLGSSLDLRLAKTRVSMESAYLGGPIDAPLYFHRQTACVLWKGTVNVRQNTGLRNLARVVVSSLPLRSERSMKGTHTHTHTPLCFSRFPDHDKKKVSRCIKVYI